MKRLHVVSDKDMNLYIVKDDGIVSNTITRKWWNDHDEQEHETIEVKIQMTLLIDIHAKFIMDGNEPYTMAKGFREINGLAYSYSVNIINVTNSIYDSSCIYSKSGIRVTDFDMYSYHNFKDEDKKIIKYDDSKLEYEVYCSLNLCDILTDVLAVNISLV